MPAPSTATLDAVLHHVDAAFDQSRDTLFSLLRIPSVSAQPAHREDVFGHVCCPVGTGGEPARTWNTGVTGAPGRSVMV